MDSPLSQLLPLFLRERAAGRALALCVLLETAGSTYSKAGALLLIAESGEYAGLLSGGCLEGDLRERARSVIATGTPCTVAYDMRGPDDLLWGLGSGCEGAMQVFMLRVGPANDWQPLAALQQAWQAQQPCSASIVIEPAGAAAPAGSVQVLGAADPGFSRGPQGERLFTFALELPPRILLLGGGPDALPICQFAAPLGWKLSVADHRPAYTDAARFPDAERVVNLRPERLADELPLHEFRAAIVMSHHLPSDLAYLRALTGSSVPFVGLLGPAPRRDRLRAELGADAARLAGRLHAPVGLELGGRSSTAIALAIVAELQAWLHGKHGGPLSEASA